MASKFFRAFNTIMKKLPGNKSSFDKVAPDIKQPRQLKQTMEKIRSENKKFGFTIDKILRQCFEDNFFSYEFAQLF